MLNNSRRRLTAPITLVAAVLVAFALATGFAGAQDSKQSQTGASEGLAVATFASGCFWCTESDFDKLDGVTETISGYIGGKTKNPDYRSVSSGGTGHTEAVQLKYDPSKISYEKLLDYYWRNVDLVDGTGQFCDRGSQYRPAIFTHSPEQHKAAEASKANLEKTKPFKSNRQIAVEITPATEFTAAETYHQDYYKKNPLRYKVYRYGCGRDARLKTLWGKPYSH